jgi:hypothetical protein
MRQVPVLHPASPYPSRLGFPSAPGLNLFEQLHLRSEIPASFARAA